MRTLATLRFLVGPIELIHATAGPGLLGLVRRGLLALWLFKIALDPIWLLARLPAELYRATGPLALLPASALGFLLSPGGLFLFWLAVMGSLLWALWGRGYRFAIVAVAGALTFHGSLVRSFGEPVHTDIVPLLAIDALALFTWANRVAAARPGVARATRRSWAAAPLVTIVALLCTAYFLVGITRLIGGGPAVFTGDTMEVWTIDAGLRGYYFDTGIGWRVPEWPTLVLLLKLGLPGITLVEILAPLCLILPHFRWLFIPFMLSFHLLSLVFLNIFFYEDMLLYLLLVDWSKRYPWLRATE